MAPRNGLKKGTSRDALTLQLSSKKVANLPMYKIQVLNEHTDKTFFYVYYHQIVLC